MDKCNICGEGFEDHLCKKEAVETYIRELKTELQKAVSSNVNTNQSERAKWTVKAFNDGEENMKAKIVEMLEKMINTPPLMDTPIQISLAERDILNKLIQKIKDAPADFGSKPKEMK